MKGSLLLVADSCRGGLGAAVQAQALWFSGRGWDVALAAPRAPSLFSMLCSVHLIDLALPATSRDVLGLWKTARQLRGLFEELGQPVVHAHGLWSFAACVCAGFRPYMTVHGFGAVPSDPFGYHLIRRFGLRAAGALAAEAFSATPELREPWVFTPYASPRVRDLVRLPFPNGTVPTFTWIGRLAEPKRPDMFVRAIARAAQERCVRGLVVGDGPLRLGLETLSRNLAAPVEFLGHVDAIEGALKQSWVVVLTSRWEAAPFAIQEGMWAGRAVVGSDLPGLRWLIGDAGYLVRSEEELLQAILALSRAAHAMDMAQKAAVRVRELLDPEAPFPQLEQRLLRSARRGAAS